MLGAMRYLLLGLVLLGCGHNDSRTVDAPEADGPPAGSFLLTSTAIMEGGIFPTENTCSGVNTSPALAWTGAPSDTKSYAVVLTDLSISLTHWVIYDIPASVTALPASVANAYAPATVTDARQTVSGTSSTLGYVGPCPRAAPAVHMYQFAVYALDVAALPGTSAQTTASQGVTAIQAHQLGKATLTGSYTLPDAYLSVRGAAHRRRPQRSSNSLQNAASVGGEPSGFGASSGQRRWPSSGQSWAQAARSGRQ
jgi:Raf kinase inhibitor-like YbhB/YbcL family protein